MLAKEATQLSTQASNLKVGIVQTPVPDSSIVHACCLPGHMSSNQHHRARPPQLWVKAESQSAASPVQDPLHPQQAAADAHSRRVL